MVLKKLKEEKEIEKIIDKGGKVKSDEQINEVTHFSLRLPKKLSEMIDEELKNIYGVSKTGWILQAIQEKLKRE